MSWNCEDLESAAYHDSAIFNVLAYIDARSVYSGSVFAALAVT